ncbi:L,D-transpeptidase [Thioalkalivibrio sp. HK1]|uniref:L,D-transpeptidase n=1 Tax=Thioalkalivibrio sp. HK1 TaxID=1469245 RepID=UPI0004726076|nr:L,D-transpeptidase [Thioalkalivibrio sp. HK1]
MNERALSKKFAQVFDSYQDDTSDSKAIHQSKSAFIRIDLGRQILELHDGAGEVQRTWPVSTAINGAGEREGSECTPRGRHIIHARVGEGAEIGTVFVGRRPTGEIYSRELARQYPNRDWILTRILWLAGTEPGRNLHKEVDTERRYIYIHGCPDEVNIGVPGSHGCIRMHNRAIVDLFDRVRVGTRVLIEE